MSSGQEKTEKPTGKRLREAREKGQVAKSREIASVGILGLGGLAIYLTGELIADQFRQMLQILWGDGFRVVRDGGIDGGLFGSIMLSFFTMAGPAMFVAVAAGVGLHAVQTKGINFSFKALDISLSNLSPAKGVKRLFSLRSLTETFKSILKLIIIAFAVYGVLDGEWQTFPNLVASSVPEILAKTASLAMKIMARVVGIMLVVALLDFLYQKWQTQKDLMMTKQELKEESKQTEGNPLIKGRIRAVQRSLARLRMMGKVPKATLVVTNPTHYAVALLYKSGMEAPQVVAKGVDHVARKIIKIARKHSVPVVQNPPLARALYKQVKLEGAIPIALYKAVAKVLAYVYQRQKRAAG